MSEPGRRGTIAIPKQAARRVEGPIEQGLRQLSYAALAAQLRSRNASMQIAAAQTLLGATPRPEAAYSFKGHLSNRTHKRLKRISYSEESWKTLPPEFLAPGEAGAFLCDYDGFSFTGKVVYAVENGDEDKEKWTVAWWIPLFGNNTISTETSIPDTVTWFEGGRGWHAEVWYYLARPTGARR